MNILEVKGLCKRFGDFEVLKGIDLTLKKGEVLSIIGSSGGGKTTLLRELIEENSCLTLKNLAVNGHDLMQLGFSGTAIGDCLNDLLAKVVDEELPNEKAALLAAVKRR